MLEGFDWLAEENTFTTSQNHVDLLLVLGLVQVDYTESFLC